MNEKCFADFSFCIAAAGAKLPKSWPLLSALSCSQVLNLKPGWRRVLLMPVLETHFLLPETEADTGRNKTSAHLTSELFITPPHVVGLPLPRLPRYILRPPLPYSLDGAHASPGDKGV